MSIARKKLAMQLRLAEKAEERLNEEGAQEITLEGFRTQCIIDLTGQMISMSRIEMRIFGMAAETMRKFMTERLFPLAVRGDVLTVMAGDDQKGIHQAFEGTVLSAVPNFNSQPDSSFDIVAQAGYIEQIRPAGANSYQGSEDAATIIAAIAKQMGYAFINNGVTAKLADQYLHGTLMNQLSTVVEATNIVCTMNNGVIAIFPNNGAVGDDEYLISPQTGLVGYPTITRIGIDVAVQFDPDLQMGAKVRVESSFPGTSGIWYVQNMRHELSTEDPDGRFFTYLMLAGEGAYVRRF